MVVGVDRFREYFRDFQDSYSRQIPKLTKV